MEYLNISIIITLIALPKYLIFIFNQVIKNYICATGTPATLCSNDICQRKEWHRKTHN